MWEMDVIVDICRRRQQTIDLLMGVASLVDRDPQRPEQKNE
jgi:hypothetical protein